MRKQITLVLLLWPLFLLAQLDSISLAYAKTQLEQGRKLRKAANYPAASMLYDSALVVFSHDSISFDTLMAETYVEQALAYRSLQQYEYAKECSKKAFFIYESSLGFYNRKLVKPLNLLGDSYISQGNNNTGLFYYNKALTVMDSVATEDDKFWPILYTNLGVYHFVNYDLDNTILFYNKALTVDEKIYEKDNLSLLIDHFNLASTYNNSEEFEEALLHYDKALQIFEWNGTLDSIYWSMIQCNVGDTYFKLEEVDKAYAIYSQSLKPVVNKDGYNSFKSRVFRSKAKCLKEQMNFEESLIFLEKGLLAATYKGGNSIEVIYDCYRSMSDVYNRMGRQKEALNFIDTAFVTINFNPEDLQLWNSKLNKVELINGISLKTKVLLGIYKGSGDSSDLILAQQNNILGLRIIDSIRLDLKEKGSHQFVTDQFFSVYENAIAIAYERYSLDGEREHLDYAFQNSEKCKSNLLLDAVLQSKALTFANLPNELLEKEITLKNEITNTERQIYTLTNEDVEKDSARISELKTQLFDFKMEMQQLVENLEQNHESYFNLKFKNSNTNLWQVQEQIGNDSSCIIEYFAGEEYFYAMLIHPDTIVLARLGKTSYIEPLVKNYVNTLSSYRPHQLDMESHFQDLSEGSFELYQLLLLPFSKFLKEQITIIPDGVLSYLSFESLVQSTPNDAWKLDTYDFLMRHYTISYNHSVELMLEQKQKTVRAPKNQLLAIAPSFETSYESEFLRSGELAPLQHNLKEAEAILALCSGNLLEGQKANRLDFLEQSAEYRAIHFATHGKANDQNGAYSYLAFSQNDQNSGDENILFAQDIYNLDLHADLVVLSACETGIGEWERGEGMISMARAFSYAGAKNILTTLWKVNDSKAGMLMQNYYRNLQNGLGKSSALRQAKMEYLADSNLEGSHPFFWASFISIGDDETMILDSPSRGIWLKVSGVGLIVALLLGVFLLKKRGVYDQWMSRRV